MFLVKKIVFSRGAGSAAGESAASVAERSRRVAAGARGAPEAFGPGGLGKSALAAWGGDAALAFRSCQLVESRRRRRRVHLRHRLAFLGGRAGTLQNKE